MLKYQLINLLFINKLLLLSDCHVVRLEFFPSFFVSFSSFSCFQLFIVYLLFSGTGCPPTVPLRPIDLYRPSSVFDTAEIVDNLKSFMDLMVDQVSR